MTDQTPTTPEPPAGPMLPADARRAAVLLDRAGMQAFAEAAPELHRVMVGAAKSLPTEAERDAFVAGFAACWRLIRPGVQA